jgi:proteasome lid subunit RPN8/RPN11
LGAGSAISRSRPEDLLGADKRARARGLDLIGIFHSHPNCEAYFSDTDLKNSCPWYSFVVLSVQDGKFDHAASFLPDPDQTRADREELICQKS